MFLLVQAHPGCLGKIQRAVKWLCVCVFSCDNLFGVLSFCGLFLKIVYCLGLYRIVGVKYSAEYE